MTKDFLEAFKTVGRKITLKKNDFFVRENEICQHIGIVETGCLFSYFEDENCHTIVSELYSKNAIISSYRSFLTGILSPGNIQAYNPSVIYVMDQEQYAKLSEDMQWISVFKNISDQLFINKCFKETSLIKLKALERYKELIKHRRNVEQDFPQHLIASYLKIRPETLSRIKSLDLHQDRL